MVEFGDFTVNLKKALKKKHMTQKDLSKRMNISEQSISKWIRGTSEPTHENIRLISTILDVSADYLLGLTEATRPKNESFVKALRLSEESIENIRYEASEKGDNRYIQILDMILSDKQTYTSLMDNLALLINPNTLLIDLKHLPESFLVPDNEDRFIQITPEIMKQLSNELPDNVYKGMRDTIEAFLKAIPSNIMLSKNAFHPSLLYTVKEEDIDNGKH